MVLTFLIAAAAVAAAAAPEGASQIRLRGAGATFPNPLYQRWVQQYERVRPGVRIGYQSIGSGGGIKAIIARDVDFAGTDTPLNATERDAAGDVLHIPTTAGATVIAYNLPNLKGELRLTGQLIAAIYLGDITRWNDERIREVNPDRNLPDLDITPTWRTDGSATTFVFTNYLCTQSEEWKQKVGAGKSVEFPVGQGGKGGVAPVVQQTPGALG
jgi:phosphate transport system substrate-binding protein